MIEVGAVANVVTVTVRVCEPVVVLHGALSILLTQYVVVVVGETVIEAPVWPAITLFGAAPVPHWKTPAVPEVPPVAVRVVLCPSQMAFVPVTAVGAVGGVFTFTVKKSADEAAEHPLSTVRTQYWVVVAGVTLTLLFAPV